jgi:hypothetical protein
MTDDDLTMKIHQDSGVVWYVQGDSPPVNTGKNIIGFMLLPALHRAIRVRPLPRMRTSPAACLRSNSSANSPA